MSLNETDEDERSFYCLYEEEDEDEDEKEAQEDSLDTT